MNAGQTAGPAAPGENPRAPAEAASASGLILSLDPGQRKLGWALVDRAGRALRLGIWPETDWEQRLEAELSSAERAALGTLVLGDGTHRMNIEAGLRRLLPETAIAVVNETGSTVDGWTLKKRHTAGGNPLKQLWFTIGQLFFAGPVDDYAAWVLALRYLKGSGTP